MSDARVPTPPRQPLRSQHVDLLLDRAGSLLTHSLDLPDTLERLGDLIVPQFADWCSVFLLDEQQDTWRLALTRHAHPRQSAARLLADKLLGEWKNSGSWTQRVLAGGEPWVIEEMDEHWLRKELPHLVELIGTLQVHSALYLPLTLDGKLLGAILLMALAAGRPRYQSVDAGAARRLATFAAAALRNARMWGALQTELTERRRMEKSLRANVTTIRTLAAGLGHDIGNVLQPLRLRLDSLASMTLPQMAAADLKALGEVMAYLQRLTSGLRLLAGDPRAESASLDVTLLDAWWRDVEAVMKDALPLGVALQSRLPGRLPPARISPAALTHVVFNLVQNAGQGMQGQSHATVRITAERVRRRSLLRMTVEDNGPALDPDTVRHGFDPFFSSQKQPSTARTGLPLVRALVQRAGGEITLHTKTGEGTVVAFTLPLAERRSRARRATSLARVARVTVEDPRSWIAVTNIVRACGFYVDQTEGLLHGHGQIWITDLSSIGGPDELLEFVVELPNRLVVIVGAEEAPVKHPRIHVVRSAAEDDRIRGIIESYEEPRRSSSPPGSSRAVIR